MTRADQLALVLTRLDNRTRLMRERHDVLTYSERLALLAEQSGDLALVRSLALPMTLAPSEVRA